MSLALGRLLRECPRTTAILLHDGCTEVREFPTFRSLQDSKSLKLIVKDIPIELPDIGASQTLKKTATGPSRDFVAV
jgi:hypothetical protein